MDLPVNQFKRNLAAGKPQIGLWMSLWSHQAVDACAPAGFDWLLLDTEHSPNELPAVQNQLDAMLAGTTEPIVRPAWNDLVLIKRYLDIGARTLLLPYVQNVEEAKRAVAATRYPPLGVRGVSGCTRANRYGRTKDYFQRVHEETCVLVQVETQAAMQEIEAIAAVDGVDGVFIGPNDLAADMGYLGNWQHPEVWGVMEQAAQRITNAGKAPGILVGQAEGQRCLDLGYLFVAVGSDLVMLARGSEDLAARFKAK
jgi:4-hydroxy-2-oxoheptanedioate aldolase